MALTSEQVQVIDELVEQLGDFLPGPAPGCQVVADSFQGIARELAMQEHWAGPSKSVMVKRLLSGTYLADPALCQRLLTLICQRSLRLRSQRNPLSREQVDHIKQLSGQLGLSLPELDHDEFTQHLSGKHVRPAPPTLGHAVKALGVLSKMREDLVQLARVPAADLGYASEQFINKFLIQAGVLPRMPLRLRDDQIVGTLDLGADTYLVECWWHASPAVPEIERLLQLLSDQVMLSGVIMIAFKGFNQDAQNRLKQGDTKQLVGVDIRDILYILDGGIHLEKALRLKAAEAKKGNSIVPIHVLLGTEERTI